MEFPVVAASQERLPENQKAALISLLADEDPSIYATVRSRLLAVGPPVCEWLRPHLLSNDPLLRRRARDLSLHFGRQAADNRFLAFCLRQSEELDLEHGVWLLTQTQYPDTNVEAYQALMDLFADELRDQLLTLHGAKSVLGVLNELLFQQLGFRGNEHNYYDPENSYLNTVMDRRTGNPISLCLIYLLVARRLRLPVAGIGLPGHFLCRYQSSSEEVFVDCFNQGKLMTKADCIHYLVRGNYDLQEDYLAPLTPRRMLMRVCGNLHRIYFHLNQMEEATRLQRYLVALAR